MEGSQRGEIVDSLQELVDAALAASNQSTPRHRIAVALTVDPLAVAKHLGIATSTGLHDDLSHRVRADHTSRTSAMALLDGTHPMPAGLKVSLRQSNEPVG